MKTGKTMEQKYFFTFILLVLSLTGLWAQTGSKYPYATTNSDGKKNVIVSRDAKGGATEDRIHPNWPATGDGSTATDLVAAKFEVALSDAATSVTFANRLTACPSGWRLPTYRELLLIAALRTQLTAVSSTFSDADYWAETNTGGILGNRGRSVNPVSGHCLGIVETISATPKFRIRCVRDLD